MSSTHTEIAIVGAGLSGLGAALALRREGIEDFVVLERAGELGGTWRDNSYPGCACDIPSILYCYRDEPNPGWTRAFALQAEIWAYMRRLAAEHGLERFIRHHEELTDAVWDEERGRWELTTAAPAGEGPGGRYSASVLVSAAGPFAEPSIPDLPGLDGFTGTTFHSAHWNHDHPLEDRRVAVVGSGASAIQFVPEIQPRVGRLTVFQRTAPWVMPRSNVPIPRSWQRRLARHPRLQSLARGAVFAVQDGSQVGFRHPLVMRLVERQGRRAIARQVADPELRARLVPDFTLGCKRVLFSSRWYPALSADNAEVVSDPIREVVPDGIVDATGRHHSVDTIIFGTGFHVTDPPIAERIRGRDGRSLAQVWQGSPQAHLGIGVAGFPNLFLLLGPNTALGHNSVLLMVEAQIDHLRKLLRHGAQVGAGTIEPTPQAQSAWVAEVEQGTAGSVWTAGGCRSWYIDDTGRNSTLWPWSVRAYERRLSRFDPDDYAWPPRPASVAAGAEPAPA
jgi:cation diffusion facilitator CzcD-associated flavoprotein CzcO